MIRTLVLCALSCALTATSATAQTDSASSSRPRAGVLPRADSSSRREPGDTMAHALERVVVRAPAMQRAGYVARRSRTATRIDASLRDVPQTVAIVGQALVADQAMQSMADVVRYLPGVTMAQGEGHRDAPTIRGIATTADFYVDGVRDDAQYLRDLYNVERVEALMGANALTFGRGGGGGVINRVTKEAGWSPIASVTLEGGSASHRRASIDVGRAASQVAAARLTAMLENSLGFRDRTSLERQGVNPTFALRLGETTIRAGVEHFTDRRTVDRGIPSFNGGPSGAAITTFFGDPDASRSRLTLRSAGATIERGSSDGFLVRNRARIVRYDKFYRNIFPGEVDAAGENVRISAYDLATDRYNLFDQLDVSYSFGRPLVRQTVTTGAEIGRQTTANYRQTGYFGGSATAITVPFARPTVSPDVVFRQSATDADNRVLATVAAAYVQHQLALGERWRTIAGVRWDRFALRFDDDRSGQTLRRTDDMISPRAGIVFIPRQPLSLHASYGVSFLPSAGDQFGSLTVTTQALEPERFTNREVGVRWEPRADLAFTGAYYRLDRTNTTSPDPLDASRLALTGRQRTAGVEIGAAGYLTPAWQIAAGWTAQRAIVLSRTTAAPAGATVPLVPHRALSLWNRYQLVTRLGAGLGLIHQARMYAAIDDRVTLPAFTRVDAAMYLGISRAVRAQLNVENLLDARYYPTSHGNDNIMPGAPRTVRLSVTATP